MKKLIQKDLPERKYNWYSDDDYVGDDSFFSIEGTNRVLEHYGIHPNDFENWGEYITHLGGIAEPFGQNGDKDH